MRLESSRCSGAFSHRSTWASEDPALLGVMSYRFENEFPRDAVEKRLQVQV